MELVDHPPLTLGEGPRWDAEHARVLLVDILGGAILHGPSVGSLTTTSVDGHVGAVAPIEGDARHVLAAIDTDVAIVDLGTGAVRPIAAPEAHRAGDVRMNDGACDPAGRFVIGSMGYEPEPGAGRLYRVDGSGRTEVLLEDCTIPNGLVWTGGGSTLLHIDSGPKTLTAYPYGSGPLGAGSVVYRHDGPGAPDGMCSVDDGTLWVAIWGEARLLHLTVDGEVLGHLDVAAQQPSACWFVGPDQDRLLITSAAVGLDVPGAADGRSMLADVGTRGIPAEAFRA